MKVYFISIRTFFSIFIFIFFNSNYYFSKSLVIIPFNFINKKSSISLNNITNPKDYFEYYLDGALYTKIKINNKSIEFHLSLDRYTTYISEKTLKEIDPESAEIQKNEDLYSLEYIGIYRAKYANSSFSFLTNKTENISLNNYSFFMVRKLTDNFESEKIRRYFALEDEEIGFNVLKGNKMEKVDVEEDEIDPYDKGDDDDYEEEESIGERYVNKNNGYLIEENTNIITQLKKQNYISSYSFVVKFDDNSQEKGKIIIGGKPHEYDPRHYSEQYFIYYKASMTNFYGNWGINFYDIQYDGTSYSSAKSVEITFDSPFILATETFKNKLDNMFFNNLTYSDYCKEEIINDYFVKYCENSIIKYFKNISFVFPIDYISNNKTNILEFSYKDLFVKAPGDNNLYVFQIIFKDGYFRWKLGLLFFKKYSVVFDQDNKIFGFYSETGEYNIDNEDNEDNDDNDDNKKNQKKKSDSNLPISWILVIILSIFLIGLAFAFYKILPYIRRKRKANELDDDYDYSSSDLANNKIN